MTALGTEDTYYSPEEGFQQLTALISSRERTRLIAVAMKIAGLRGFSWEDLLQEVQCRVLEGTRRMPRDVTPMAFMVMTMRSLANVWSRPATREQTGVVLEFVEDRFPSAEQCVEAKSDLNLLFAHFQDDDEVQDVLQALLQEQDKAYCVQSIFNGDERRYETVRKRLRRGVSALFESDHHVKEAATHLGKAGR